VNAIVGIVMGSDSDLPVVQDAVKTLDMFQIAYEVTVISAHRTPDDAMEYARTAETRGLKVIIAAAGGAAHLAGVLASMTPLPVIGIPIGTSALGGVDSLYSTVQMPSGVPVATVGINGARNAAVLAAQILGTSDMQVRSKVKAFKLEMEKQVRQKADNVKRSLMRE
jgi:5-(carboxyamino)imidazole ribonucleotide mutase